MERETIRIYVFLLTWTHLGHQGCPKELRGDFQEHFNLEEQFGQLVCDEDKANQNGKSKNRYETKHVGTDRSAVAGLGEALWLARDTLRALFL